jgi:hypothetical protein
MKNWETSIGGILLAIGAICTQVKDNPTLVLIGGVLSAVGALILGLAAKDHNVTGGTKTQ